MSEFDHEVAVAMELVVNGQSETGFFHFISALESLLGKVDSDNAAIIEHETENVIAIAFEAIGFDAEHRKQFQDYAKHFFAELDEKHLTEGATPEVVKFTNYLKEFTQNLINRN